MAHHTQKGKPSTKNWMATIFDLKIDPKSWGGVKYCVWQKELCPTTKKEHFQLFVQFEKRCFRTKCLKLYKGDWRPARYPEKADLYCQKEKTRIGGPWTIGEFVKRGNKMNQIKEDILDGATEKQIMLDHIGMYIRYSTGIRRARALMTKERTEITQITWIWGASGSGKSTYARKLAYAGDRSVFYKHPTNKWFDGYEQEDVVVIDDYKGALYPALLFNLGGNKHPMKVEIKCGSTDFCATEIIITSVKHPCHCYGDDTHAWSDGLKRRVKGATYYMDKEHIVYKTDWSPSYRGDLEEPTICAKRRKLKESINILGIPDLTGQIDLEIESL